MPELILSIVTLAGILITLGLQLLTLPVIGALYAQLKRLTPKD